MTVLIGRGRELAAIAEVTAAARRGRAGALLVIGEPGVGKTSLLAEIADRAGDVALARVAAVEPEHVIPFAGLSMLLAQAGVAAHDLPAPQEAALAVALARREGAAPSPLALGAAVLGVLAAWASAGPALLLIDDAQWLDPPSARALAFAIRRLDTDPIAVVAALRPDTDSPLVAAGLPHVPLGGLDDTGSRDLVATLGIQASPEWVATARAATGGNPLALRELLRDPSAWAAVQLGAPAPIPTALATVYAARAAALGTDAQALVSLVAIAPLDARLLALVLARLGIDPSSVGRAEDGGLVRRVGGRLELTHPLVGSGAYASLTSERRRELHTAVAKALPHTDDSGRAQHLALSAQGPDEEIAGAIEACTRSAERRGAHMLAAIGLDAAADLSPDPATGAGRLLSAAEAAWRGGDGVAAKTLAAKAIHLEPRPWESWRALAVTGRVEARTGSPASARSALLRAACRAARLHDPATTMLLAEVVNACFYLADDRGAARAATLVRALTTAGEIAADDPVADLTVAMADILAGHPAADLLRKAARSFRTRRAPGTTSSDSFWAMLAEMWLREADVSAFVDAIVEEERASLASGTLPRLLFHRARYRVTADQWSAGLADYLETIDLARQLGQVTEEATALAGAAVVEARMGLREHCLEHARAATELAEPRGNRIAQAWAKSAVAELALAEGRIEEAIEGLSELDRWLSRNGIHDVDLAPGAELAEALVLAGEPQRATAAVDGYDRRAALKGQPWARARAARARGLCAADADIDAIFEAAIALHERTPDCYELARTRLAYGQRLRRVRRRVDARVQLRAALADFELLGATPWADAADRELSATGERAARRDLSASATLSPRERQIATMVAAGRTNRDTAAALFVSPKTVEYHLRKVYQRLGITSRTELSELLSRPPG